MGILTRRINCAGCDSKNTRTITSTSTGQYKKRFLFGRAYYCCDCGHRGRIGGGIRALKLVSISALSGILLLSLYGNFIGFQRPDVTPVVAFKEIAIDQTPDTLLLKSDPIAYVGENEATAQSQYEPLTSLITLNERQVMLQPNEGIERLNTHIPLYWRPIPKADK